MKAYMQSISSSGMVHHGCLSVAESGRVANWMGDEGGVYIIQYVGRSACRPMVTVSFCCLGMSSQLETTFFAAESARLLPLMFVCPLIVCSIVVSPNSAMSRRESTIATMSSL